ncbi:helix-turn-helix domain-containing protein [Pelomonas sp. UHG3]|uniref:Helix-turn-helix domain-containing protein n=1 Tax=Roseateles hydrophilus TaxID=2975054 RepID=A0ACC6C9N7_9BURK|nr:helix-turn-helix transcriptional regulator [Pelomonas sp. UHG3]MCY4745120.1 helix-turn-helix domain-containing protein [Pelomonas sp. UHG3]
MSDEDHFERQLAERLAALRMAAGWSLDELATRSGVSRATLSRLERGETSPTATLLSRLARAHGLPLSRLLAEAEALPVRLLRAADQPRWHDQHSGFERRMRCPPLAGFATEVIEAVLAPGAELVYDEPPVARLEHHLCLLDGQVRLTLQGQPFELAPGDSLSFRCQGRSIFANPGDRPARYLLAMTVPTL